MATTIDLYKSFQNQWNLWTILKDGYIEREELNQQEKLFIEVSLFTEIYWYTQGTSPDDVEAIEKALRKVNPVLNQTDNPEQRQQQVEMIMEIYKSHYIAFNTYKDTLQTPYILVAYLNRFDFSFKPSYIEQLFGKKKSLMSNARFKKPSFDKTMNGMFDYYSQAQLGYDKADNWGRWEIVRTVLLFQVKRGFMEGDVYE